MRPAGKERDHKRTGISLLTTRLTPDRHRPSRRVIMGLPTATRRRSEPCASTEPNSFPEGLPARFGGACAEGSSDDAALFHPGFSRSSESRFRTSRRPVSCGFGLTIGAGQVFPEVNFTLPVIDVIPANW